MTVAEIRLEAAKAGVSETGRYLEWLEREVLHLRQQRDEFFAANNCELERRRKAEAAAKA